MSYIGPEPYEAFTSYATETFTTSSTTSYTLAHSVANENELALFINNVRQQPGSGKAYTASGTALTLSAATASTDTMYAIYLGRALQTSVPATNSITSAMLSLTGITDNASATSISIDSTGAVTMPLQPAFSATITMTNIPLSTQTTMTLNERFDTNADLSSNTFTAPVTGKYYLGYHVYLNSVDADHTVLDVKIITSNKTHSVTWAPDNLLSADSKIAVTGSQICDMDASDTATFGIYIVGGAAQTDIHGDSTASGMLIG